jgi:hypothetical protein
MATITPSVSRDIGERDGSCVAHTWDLLTASPDGAPLEWSEWGDRTWQASGTWGGATLTLQGSNSSAALITAGTAVWFTLSNAAGGSAATFTADGGKTTIETPRWVRPNLTVVGVAAEVKVVLVSRRHTPLRT